MAITEVVVPIKDKSISRAAWIEEIGLTLDIPKDVKFVDADGNDAYVNQINLVIDGYVKYYPIKLGSAYAVRIYLTKGVFHEVLGIHYIYGTAVGGTDAGLLPSVKL